MAYEATTDNFQIRNANKVTFVGTSNTIIDTTTGRIQTKGFQHNSNVITDISGPHGRVAPTLKKYPEIIFEDGKFDKNDTTNTYVQAGYTVTASSVLSSVYTPWRIFDDYLSGNDGWATLNRYNASSPGEAQSGLGATQFPAASGRYGEYIDLQLPHGIKVTNFIIKTRPTQSGSGTWMPEDSPGAGYLYGSNNGTTWTEIKAFSGLTYGGMSTNGGTQETVQVDSTVAYKYLRLQVTHRAGQNSSDQYLAIGALEYYGTEEYTPAGDHSVDTTFMSRFNNPQLTGVQVLVDGATGLGTNQISGGVDPSGNNETYDATNKYWTLNGTLTSNLSVEANTFFEGDQPHAVSVWFNSSNLEANVSNTCVFSISDQEKLDSDNLTLQSNTWHNLTYTYQGEGGSKVTYLDGVKVVEGITDTFGEYPPSAMTGLSQGGYVLSTNGSITSGSTNASPYYAFDNQINNFFGFGLMATPGTGTNQTGGPTMPGTVDGSTLPSGYWLKLELPHKLHVNSYNITPRGDQNQAASSPLTWKVYGSNDDSVWTLLHEKTDSTPINPQVSTTNNPGSTFAVSTIGSFKYLALIVLTNAGYAYLNLGELQFYGHRENDLVRLPDPTNVLKYPHVALTGPAQRGYVVTESSLYLSSGQAIYPGWEAFDHNTSSNNRWASENAQNYNGGSFLYSGNKNLGTNNGGSGTPNGEWLMIEMPHKLKLQSTKIFANGNALEVPDKFIIYGSNNLTGVWSVVDNTYETTSAAIPYIGTGKTWTVSTSASPVAYKYFGLVVRNTTGSTYITTVNEWELYGTEEGSIPLQIGGGNIDKVANFRVYDKFVGEDQALEIWDAQKDYFGRAKSSMTLHKGRLGIGTTEPTSTLDVSGTVTAVTFAGDGTLLTGVALSTDLTALNATNITTGTLDRNTTGSAATLTTPRSIGGVDFDGSAAIVLPGVDTTGTQNTSGSAATLTTPRAIGGVNFDGSAAIVLPGVNSGGNQNTSGSAATLTTARAIGGVSFDGSVDITPTTFTTATFSGDVTVDSTTFHVDSTNNRVGIGTTNPLTIFDTHGTSRISTAYPRFDFYTTTSRSTDAWGNSTGAAGDYRIYANGDASDGTKRSLNFDYGQNSVHTSRMVINAAGNVGIGTTNPGEHLHIYHPTYGVHRSVYWNAIEGATTDLKMGYLGSSDPSHASGALGLFKNSYEGSTEDETVRIQGNGVSWFNGGNVGIGTTSPGTMLDIVKSGDPTLRIRDTDSDGKARIQLLESGSFTDGVPRYGTEISYDGNNNKFHISTFDGSTTKRDDLTITRSSGNVELSGYLKSANPAFYAYRTTPGNADDSYITYDSSYVNLGNHMNVSGGIFTCPVAGIYTFTWGGIGKPTNGVFRYYIRKNNSQIDDVHLRLDNIATGIEYGDGERTVMLSLAATDTIRIHYQDSIGSEADYGYNYTYFQGHLISYT